MEQQWIVGKVASALCVGGQLKYDLVADCGVNLHWSNENVLPGTGAFYDKDEDNNSTSEVLGLAVLWCCLDASYSELVDSEYVERIVRRANKLV